MSDALNLKEVSAEDRKEILQILKRIPEFSDKISESIEMTRLGGLTNRNFRLDMEVGQFVLRIPGVGTSDYINRKNESHAAKIAARAGVNAEVLFFDESNGIMLCRFIEGGITLNAERFKDLGSVKRAGIALRRMHECKELFLNRFELFQMIDEYLGILERKGAELPDGYREVKKEAEVVREALQKHPLPIVPCHCDPLAENFIDTGNRVYIIDWEYSGNNDPMWDLGDLAVEAGFTQEQEETLFHAYFGGLAPKAARGRMVLYKAMCDLLWTLWGIIQHVNKNPADDFGLMRSIVLKDARIL